LVWRDYGRHGFEGVAYPETSKRNIIEDICNPVRSKELFAVLEIFEGGADNSKSRLRLIHEER
jgi:hypothetical protein